jgi:hypothetical protein
MVRSNAMASKALNRFLHCRYHGPLPKSESLAIGQSRETTPNSGRSLAPLTIPSHEPDSSGLFAPLLSPRVFSKCQPIRRMIGWGGGGRTNIPHRRSQKRVNRLDSNRKLKKSKCFIQCRLGTRKPFFLSLKCTEFVPNSQSIQC